MTFSPLGGEIGRYEKRVLLPMGEYIPFSFLKDLCARYGVKGSFTQGKEAKVEQTLAGLVAPSICYEETFGGVMREGKLKGAEMLVNLTNDAWYPHSTLSLQHLEHARLRTVEMGVPLVRACNTGITCAIDSFGQTVDILHDHGEVEDVADSLYVEVPKYHYWTLYSLWGDHFILAVSMVGILFALPRKKRDKR